MARFVPNVLTADALKRLGIPAEQFSADLPKMVKAGLDRLAALQREDGGWGWFDRDRSDSFMTACAVGGLAEAKRLGFPVDAVRLETGEACARRMAKAEQDLNRLAFLCAALSRGAVVEDVERLMAAADKLSPYALSATALALHRWNRPEAADFRKRLVAKAKDAHWETTDWNHKWENVAVETTAMAILALSEGDPSNPAIPPAVEWMLGQRSGSRWKSTKDTAAAIHAVLSHAVATGGKLDTLARAVEVRGTQKGTPQVLKKVRLDLNGASQEVLVDLNNPLSCRFEWHVAGRDLVAGENRIVIRTDDEFEFDLEGTLRTTGVPAPPGTSFTVSTSTDRPLDGLRVGDEITVTATIRGQADSDYVMAQVPVPAGCEVIAGSGDGGFSRFEARYEEAIFYLRSCGPTPTVLRFKMRCAFAGAYTTLAPTASVMYDEAISGTGESRKCVIK